MAAIQPRAKSKSNFVPQWVLSPPTYEDVRAMLAEMEALDLPGSDGEPMENERERIQIDFSLDILNQHWQERNDFYAGGNMFIYFDLDQAQTIIQEINESLPRRTFRGPDLFVVLDVDGSYRRQKWVVWQEDGRFPNVIIELMSPSTRHIDLDEKKQLYERTFHTAEYFCFDYLNPDNNDSLIGWRLDANGRYQPVAPDERGWLWSEELQLWLGKWNGVRDRDDATWLRFYTTDGELLLSKSEAAERQAEAAERQAEAAERQAEAAERQAAQEAAARQAAEAENARLRAELARLRGNTD
ncbi:MAG: Uma2 family endonuclease [Caldilineaceae bacterium]